MSAGSYPMNDVEANGSKVTFSEKSSDREKKLRIAVIILAILTCGLLIALIVVATLGKKSKKEEICTEPSCVKSANFLLNSMNMSVDPCEDFYQFSCGKWIADHMDDHGTRTLQAASDKLEKDFKEIFNLAKKKKTLPKSVSKIIEAFDVCVAYEGLDYENKGWIRNKTKLAGGFPLIEGNKFRRSFASWTDLYIKQYQNYMIDFPLSISIFSNPLNSIENVIHVAQPPLESELPPLDKDVLHQIADIFGNNDNSSIERDIDDIFWLKEKVTNLSRPYPELMENEEEYQLVTIEELEFIYPKVDWLSFLSEIFKDFLPPGTTITENDKVFLRGKTFIGEIIELFESRKISERMLLNHGGAMFMNELLTYNRVEQSSIRIKLKRKRTSSTSEIKWSQCKDFLTKTASPVLDYLYGQYRTDKTISKELIDYMAKAMEEMIDQSTWLDEPTKKSVQDKLKAMVPFLSLPPWTQNVHELEEYFKELPEMTDNSFENMNNLRKFDAKKMCSLYRKKNDRTKWPRYAEMGGSQVNAYYVPDFNIVVIPAGIQQLPYYHSERPKYMNFGGMGLIYGHEMTHGLDESGSLRDKYGNLKNWWTDKAKTEFKKRSNCFVKQYSSYHYRGLNVTVDGRQTLSENIADNGGLRQAYLGYQKWVKDHGKEKRLPGLEKYSPEQLFFVSFAESWCSSIHPPSLVASSHEDDSHSADEFRVIGSLANMKEFSEVFNCKPGSKMNPKNKCIIW